MFPFDPEFIFTERMKINMDKEAYEGLQQWAADLSGGMIESAAPEQPPGVCTFCDLAPCFVDVHYANLFIGAGSNLEALGLKNNEIRHGLYREAFWLWKGHVGKGVRMNLSHCVTINIQDAYPDPNGNYVGYKSSKDDCLHDDSSEKEAVKPTAKKRSPKSPVESVKPVKKKAATETPFGYPSAVTIMVVSAIRTTVHCPITRKRSSIPMILQLRWC
jgi:hypothetical protein